MKKSRSSKSALESIRQQIAAWILSCLSLLLLAGCSHLTSKLGQPLWPPVDGFAVGHESLSNVLRVVGPPSRITAAAGGFAMLYEYNEVEEKQLGFNITAPVLRWFKFVGAKSWLEHQAWLLTFDTNGTLQGWGQEHWRQVLGRGSGAQILVTVSSLVDSSQVRRPAPQHEWAKGWLMPLPRLLNSGQSLDSGTKGLEQTLSPTVVGQRTLEMTPPPKKFPKKK